MHGATEAMIGEAARSIIAQVEQPIQSELLVALGVFAEPLMAAERFVRLVTKERLMASDLISLLVEDVIEEKLAEKTAALEQQTAALEQQTAALKQQTAALKQQTAALVQENAALHQTLLGVVEETVLLRFPAVVPALLQQLRQVTDPAQLQRLHAAVLQASDQAAVEQLLAAFEDQNPSDLAAE
jgi:hypothetical protein